MVEYIFKTFLIFKTTFGFQDKAFGFQDKANWLVIDNTIAILSALILIKKFLRFLRYLHLNIFFQQLFQIWRINFNMVKYLNFFGRLVLKKEISEREGSQN